MTINRIYFEICYHHPISVYNIKDDVKIALDSYDGRQRRQNRDYNRSLTPVRTFDVFVPLATFFLASKPKLAQ